MLTLERSYTFSASHLYRRPEWSEERNRAVFGRCANLPGHGHNYRLTVWVAGEVDRETGFLVSLPQLDGLMAERVLARLDHQHLNFALPEFESGREIPTSESLVRWIAGQLVDGLPAGTRLVKVRLAEDQDLAAEWLADPRDASG